MTGVLPIALGRGTRIVQALLNAGKEYVCLMYLHKDVGEKEIMQAIGQFKGGIKQMPPVRSAVKRQERTRQVYYIDVIEIRGRYVLFRVGCEAGTYIRKLTHMIGQKLGVGAHMAELIRTRVANFTDRDWVTLHDLVDAYALYKEDGNEKEIRRVIRPIEHAVSHMPKVWALDTAIDPVCHGTDLACPGITRLNSDIKVGDMVAVLSQKNELVCLGKSMLSSEEILNKGEGIVVKASKVFMKIGTYPRYVKK